jgi:FAD/FMN-containing dehydrogenase
MTDQWDVKNWGWACESVVAIDVVTPGGQLVRADANTNEDLFWAARGGGPAFPGIVTRFHLRTQSAPRVMRSSVYVFPSTHYKTALSWALEVCTTILYIVIYGQGPTDHRRLPQLWSPP